MHSFYLNYFTIALITGLILAFASGIFIFLMHKKSKPTIYLGIVCLNIALVNLMYAIAQGFYNESVVPGRVVLLITIYIFLIFVNQFFLRFPSNTRPKLTRVIFILELIFAIAIGVYLVNEFRKSPVYYSYSGHYYEYDNYKAFKIYGAGVVFLMLCATIVVVWKVIISQGKNRLGIILMYSGFAIGTVVPAILNTLNRDGAMDRSPYITMFCQMTLIGVFIWLVAYINNTRDRTTFMFKVVGISFLIYMVIANMFFYAVLMDRDTIYDTLHLEKLNSIIYTKDTTNDLKFASEYNIITGEINYLRSYDNLNLKTEPFRYEAVNAFLLDEINALPAGSDKQKIIDHLNSISNIKDIEYSKGYIELIKQHSNSYSDSNNLQAAPWTHG